jgi:exodeoxyribonuclease VII large subunit
MRHEIAGLLSNAGTAVDRRLSACSNRLSALSMRLSPVSLAKKVGDNKRRLGVLEQRAFSVGGELPRRRQRKLDSVTAGLQAMSPLKVLDRGYSITQTADGKILRDAAEAGVSDALRIRLAKGELGATVTDVKG